MIHHQPKMKTNFWVCSSHNLCSFYNVCTRKCSKQLIMLFTATAALWKTLCVCILLCRCYVSCINMSVGVHILLWMWTLTFQGGWAAPGQLECVSITAERLLLVAVQKFPEGAEAPPGTTQCVLSCLRLHDLTVLIVHHSFILKIKRQKITVKFWSICQHYFKRLQNIKMCVGVLHIDEDPDIKSLPPPQRT